MEEKWEEIFPGVFMYFDSPVFKLEDLDSEEDTKEVVILGNT